jgi:hypothetical protein
MKAEPLIRERRQVAPDAFVDAKVWRVPKPVLGSEHGYKYSLALVVENVCILRYDNEAGKGDHRHHGATEVPYLFTSIDRLIDDFTREVRAWLKHRTS